MTKALLRTLLLGAFPASFGTTLAYAQQPGNAPLEVCDVLKEPQRHRNQIVEISGELLVGRHGAALMSDKCQADRRNRLSGICLTAAGYLDSPEVQFTSNTAAQKVVFSAQRTLGELDSSFRASAVLEGQLFFEDQRGGTGFCHSNLYPVLMVVKDVKRYCVWRDSPAQKEARARIGQSENYSQACLQPEKSTSTRATP